MKKTMKNLTRITLISTIALLTACSSSPDKDEPLLKNAGPQTLYTKAKEQLTTGNYNAAVETLSALDSRFPFGPLSHQVQLDLIFAYYKTGKTDQAIATIDRFIRLNPNHSDVDFALHMRGLVNLDADKNLFQEMLGIDRSDRDPSYARQAFEDFRSLIEKFPNSRYAADAKQRMVAIKDRLARYEIEIARFYMERQAWVAAANRGQYVVEYYSDTPHVKDALQIMIECYDQLGLDELKQNARTTLLLNFPDAANRNDS
ncbi:outer membrane protein assembly factor BamD [Pseudobowmanella zhangzhouensis]|nr:membrane protein [Bowmanella sp. JS7-9]